MTITPNSESLTEFNPCHSPHDGRFSATDTAGRCAGVALGFRKREAGLIRDMRKVPFGAGRIEGWMVDATAALFRAKERISVRQHLARGTTPLPSYLRTDAKAALRDHRANTIVDTMTMNPGGGSANRGGRTVRIHPAGASRASLLNTLRHEYGHLSPTKINATMIGGFHLSTLKQLAEYGMSSRHENPEKRVEIWVEEVRAWRNAIRDSKGKVGLGRVRQKLGSYAKGFFGELWGADVIDATMDTLTRYAGRVRRASRKGAK